MTLGRISYIITLVEKLAHRQMVRHWTLTPAFQGSNPCGPAFKASESNPVLFVLIKVFDGAQCLPWRSNAKGTWCESFAKYIHSELKIKKRLASFDKIYYGNIDELLTKENGNLVWNIRLI